MKKSPFISLLVLPALIPLGHLCPGPGDFLLPFCCFFLHPLAGLILPRSASIEVHHEEAIQDEPWFRIILLGFIPILLGLTIGTMHEVSSSPNLSTLSFIGLVLSIGTMNGVLGFTVAHECIHHRERIDRIGGHSLLFQNGYAHYAVEHLHGHHVYGCTPEDPHTARFNEPLYTFLLRSIRATWQNAWTIEKRLGKKKAGHGVHHIIDNLMIQAAIYAAIVVIFGPRALVFLLAQSAVAIFLLHSVDYLQHYGLMRKEITAGRYERTTAMHAWATGDHIEQFNLFQLDKHADHHLHPARHYEKLVGHVGSPQLPLGYAGMILLAMFPKAWFKTVNPLILHAQHQSS